MTRHELGQVLFDIIAETPNTKELYPLLCALAEVASELQAKPKTESPDNA
jgi:hypothetical protein